MATPGGREILEKCEEFCGGTEKGMRARVMSAQGQGEVLVRGTPEVCYLRM